MRRHTDIRVRSAALAQSVDFHAEPAHAGTASHSGHRSVDDNCFGVYRDRSVQLRFRQVVCSPAESDAPPDWHRRKDPAVGDLQTRRPLCEEHADARRSRRNCQSQRSGWKERLLLRRPYSVVVAALTNKLARTVLAVLVKGQETVLKESTQEAM